MDPLTEEYYRLYPKDLVEYIGMIGKTLQPVLTTHVLLNPMFGIQARLVGSDLLTRAEYAKGRSSKFGSFGNPSFNIPHLTSLFFWKI